jgi:hypothetical protein
VSSTIKTLKKLSERLNKYNFYHPTRISNTKQDTNEDRDWGGAEQSALERLMDDNTDFISGEEMIDWIDRLKAGEDV